MATVTLTATVARAMAPTYKPTSTITKSGTYVTSACLSVADVIMFQNIRIPHGAVITDIQLRYGSPDTTSIMVFDVGTQGSGSSATLFGSKTLSVTTALSTVYAMAPTTVSVSDDSVDRFQTFALRLSAQASGTPSASIVAVVQYYCP
jgi:hypothetical protein